jgi:hypothetical protein
MSNQRHVGGFLVFSVAGVRFRVGGWYGSHRGVFMSTGLVCAHRLINVHFFVQPLEKGFWTGRTTYPNGPGLVNATICSTQTSPNPSYDTGRGTETTERNGKRGVQGRAGFFLQALSLAGRSIYVNCTVVRLFF